MTIILYTRAGCHLCEQARAILERAGQGLAITIAPVDVDADPVLQAAYRERVPVALVGEVELAWPFTREQARRLLEGGARNGQ